MAARYWVGGSGNWDSSSTTHWSTSSGGASGASVPTSSDDVIFDSLSNATAYTVTITATANCANFTMAGPLVGQVTWAGSSNINIYGSLNLSGGTAGINRTYLGSISFKATSTGKTITMNGVTLQPDGGIGVTFDGSGGGWTLQDTFNIGAYDIYLTRGSLDTNGKSVTCGNFDSSASNTRTLTLGASTITLTASGTSTMLLETTNLTFSGASSTITTTGDLYIYAPSLTLGTISCASLQIDSSLSCTTATIAGNGGQNDMLDINTVNAAVTFTVSGTLTITGYSATDRVFVYNSGVTYGYQATISAGTTSLTNVDFQDIAATGAAAWSGTSVANGGNNSGITFTSPVTRYWVGNGGNWSSTSHWSSSSGGSSGASVPTCQDTVIFDANSISSGSQTIYVDIARFGKDISFSAVTNNPTLDVSSINAQFFGSLTLKAGMTTDTTDPQSIQFNGRSAATLTTNTVDLDFPLFVVGYGALLSLGSDLTFSTALTGLYVTGGEFSDNNYNITATAVFLGGEGPSDVVIMGNGTWTLTGTGDVLIAYPLLSLTPGTATIKITNTSNTATTFQGGDLTYYNIWYSRGASTASNTIVDSNTFNNFMTSGSAAHSFLFTTGITTTVSSWTVSGTSGNLVTINSTTTGTHSLVKSGGGTISSDYLNIQHSVATPSSTWYAGTHSTNNQAVATAGSGWIFTAPPSSTSIASFNGLAYASTATVNGLAVGSMATFNGLA